MVTGDAMNPNTRIGITTKDTPEAVQTLVSENINKQYKDGIKANTDITLSVRPGEILGLLRQQRREVDSCASGHHRVDSNVGQYPCVRNRRRG